MTDTTDDALICFILDRSSSMLSVTNATCEGFNQFKKDQTANPSDTFMTLTLFDTVFDTRFAGAPLDSVPDLGLVTNSYYPNGCTALFDAVGTSIKATEEWVDSNNWLGRVMVVVLTDGAENSSKSWHVRHPRVEGDAFDVAGLISWKQKEGWDFVFLGAGGTEWLEKTFHELPKQNFFGYDGSAGSTRSAYATMDCAVTQSRITGQTLASALVDQEAGNE